MDLRIFGVADANWIKRTKILGGHNRYLCHVT